VSTFSNPLTEYSPQMEFASGEADFEDESVRGVFDEDQGLQLAAALLEVVNEQQLDRFIVDLVSEAANATGHAIKQSQLAAIRDVLRNSVHQILPMASLGHGSMRSSIGAQLGTGLSAIAGQVLGLELEGLSPEDREFEAARQFVRFAAELVKKTLESPRDHDQQDAAHRAAAQAAKVYAPGLFANAPGVHGSRGHWVWCGDKIILFGV
jgi:hypothetical protein